MKEELVLMAQNQVWDLVLRPDRVRSVDCKWVFKTKTEYKGRVKMYKATLIAKRFTQMEDNLFSCLN